MGWLWVEFLTRLDVDAKVKIGDGLCVGLATGLGATVAVVVGYPTTLVLCVSSPTMETTKGDSG